MINLTITVDEKEKSPHFAFLLIYANAHLAHLQSRASQPTNPSFAKEPNLANALFIRVLEIE